MMKNYPLLKLCVVLFCIMSFNAGAQVMGGIFTIDNTLPASATNFTSFTAFAARINTAGVNAPVTINVGASSGPYTEQVTFIQAPGISATNTVTINGNGRTITFGATTATSLHTIMLQGADYMTFNDLIVNGTNTTYALTVHLWSQASFNQFFNCRITAPMPATSSNLVPFSMSGSATSPVTAGDHGNNTTISSCTITGGYYGLSFYGMTASPYNLNTQVLNCYIHDWYNSGVYEYYDRSFVVRGNIVERPNLTSSSTTYGMNFNMTSPGSIIERNHVRRLFDAMLTNANTSYALYFSSSGGAVNNEMQIRNNIASDIRSNGPIYGMYAINGTYYQYYHNTISIDDAASTYNGQSYGILFYAQYFRIKNNIISMKRGGGAGSNRIGITVGSPVYTVGFESKNNVFNIGSPTGSNSIGSYNAIFMPSLSAWQIAVNQDLFSMVSDPLFTGGGNYLPTSMLINNTSPPLGLAVDFAGTARSMVMPDPGALEFYTVTCAAAPPTTGIAAPGTSICPGSTVALVLGSSTFTNSGYTVQWYSSTTSSLTGFTAIAGGTANTQITPPVTGNTYYNAVITCVNTSQTATTTVGAVLVAQTNTSTVPYYESFETLSYNTLPNCSWTNTQGNNWPISPAATFLQSNNRVPRTGNGYAVFTNTPSASTHYFYSNGIWMEPGITYSASMWYLNEAVGYNPWSDISMYVGPGQNTTGQMLIASSNGPVASFLYSPLTNTFMVTAPALYYVGVKATSTTGSSPYITWDDLSIIIPCSLNEPSVSLTIDSDTICDGEYVTITANGLSSLTYTWSMGANTSVINVNPNTTTTYYVTGLEPSTSCSTSASQLVVVNSLPSISAIAFPVGVCTGAQVNLTSVGSSNIVSYSWSSGGNTASTLIVPTANTVYSVTGTDANGCAATATLQVAVFPKPTPTITISRATICRTESISLTGSGALSYVWAASASGLLFTGATVMDAPMANTNYTLTATDANGCTATAVQAVTVMSCSGVNELSGFGGLKVYPNPASGVLFVEFDNAHARTLQLVDLTGRVLYSGTATDQRSELNLENLSNGIYYLKIRSEKSEEVIKVVKH